MDEEHQNYFLKLEVIPPKLLAKILIEKRQPKGFSGWILKNEIRPISIYCYLYAKYGPPNGFMNFLRNDSSDNLVHWEWTLMNDDGMVMFQGHNYRTEVQFLGNFNRPEITKANLVSQIKADLGAYAKQMTAICWRRYRSNPVAEISLTQSDSSRTTIFAGLVLIRRWFSRVSAPGSIWHWREQRYAQIDLETLAFLPI